MLFHIWSMHKLANLLIALCKTFTVSLFHLRGRMNFHLGWPERLTGFRQDRLCKCWRLSVSSGDPAETTARQLTLIAVDSLENPINNFQSSRAGFCQRGLCQQSSLIVCVSPVALESPPKCHTATVCRLGSISRLEHEQCGFWFQLWKCHLGQNRNIPPALMNNPINSGLYLFAIAVFMLMHTSASALWNREWTMQISYLRHSLTSVNSFLMKLCCSLAHGWTVQFRKAKDIHE